MSASPPPPPLLCEQERLRDFIQKRERGELLIQKIKKLQDNILKKVIFKEAFVYDSTNWHSGY